MWFRSLFNTLKSRSARAVARHTRREVARRRPATDRLLVEPLEDRSQPSTYFAYNLGTLGGAVSDARDINALGQAVGDSTTAADSPAHGVAHAFIWDRGTMTDLGSLGGPTFSSGAWGVNDAGQVVGTSERPNPNGGFPLRRAFLVTPEDIDGNGTPDRWYRDSNGDGINDMMRDLGTFANTNDVNDNSEALDINSAGQVTGWAADRIAGGLNAFRWQDGVMTKLSLTTYGLGINDSGDVVGAGGPTNAFFWDDVGGMVALANLPGQSHGTALAINNAGTVVGNSGPRPVLWPSISGSPVDLGTLPGATTSWATGINDAGQVVGYSWWYYPPSQRAFLWQGGVMTGLADLMPSGSGWTFDYAWAINDAGQIVGSGARAGDTGGAFLLSPFDLGIPLLSINDRSITEGSGGVTNVLFTVNLSAPSTLPVTVDYATADGNAMSGMDYAAASGTLTFNPGEASKTVTVPVYSDTLDELQENFFVNLSRTTNAAFADSRGVGTIVDDDPIPTLVVNDVRVVEGDSGTTNAVFTVTLSTAADRTRTVWYETDGYWSEYPSDDHEDVGGYLTFAPGQTVQTFAVGVYGDTTSEVDEFFQVFVSYDGAASLSDNGTCTIVNDDPILPMPDVSNVTVIEGNTGATNAVFTVTLLMGPLAEPATFTYQTADAFGAVAGIDYQAVSGTLTFAPGETQRTISVPVYGDTLCENTEFFYLTVSNPTQLPLTQASNSAAIINDDPVPTVSVGNATGLEGYSGTTLFAFTVTLSAPAGFTFWYGYQPEGGTASPGSDYVQAFNYYLSFAPGETSKVVTVPVNGDNVIEPDETFFLQLYGAGDEGYWFPISGLRGMGTILNDDTNYPLVSITDVSVTEGNGGTKNAVFTVSLAKAPSQTAAINFSTTDGSAIAGADYQSVSGTLTFAPGETTKTVTVPVTGDRLPEPNETFFVNLDSPVNLSVADGQGRGTIVDDEPRISISDVSKKEGNGKKTTLFVFTVTLSAAYDQPVTMSFQTANGTATTGDNDYVAQTGTITFNPGETSKTITIAVKSDGKKEADETFYLDLFGNGSNSLFTKNRGIGTILNDD